MPIAGRAEGQSGRRRLLGVNRAEVVERPTAASKGRKVWGGLTHLVKVEGGIWSPNGANVLGLLGNALLRPVSRSSYCFL
jgi:hypothetical protein